jgi:hypothetical protein
MEQLDWLKIASIVIPLGVLLLGILNYFKNVKLREKQQETISDLIKTLGENKVEFHFMELESTGGGGPAFSSTLLDIGTKKSQNVAQFDEVPVYFRKKSNRIKGIEEFTINPYLPSEIKEILINLSGSPYDNIDSQEITYKTPFVTLDTGCFIENLPFERKENEKPGQLKLPDAIAYATWLSFKTTCGNLVKEINRQLDIINARDLKIS